MWLLTWMACGAFDVDLPPGVGTPSAAEIARDRAREMVSEKSATMQAQMIQELGAKRPDAAITGTTSEPDALAWHAASTPSTQGQVGITALKLRNPANQAPAWVQAWLTEHEGSEYDDVQGVDTVVDTPQGKVARVLEPVPMLAQCVRCHGHPDQIPADVRTELERRYPADQSLGYEVGDLRGAVWSEVALGDG